MTDSGTGSGFRGLPERLIEAASRLLAERGPSAVKARTVSAAAGLSTMVVHSHFGGVPEPTRAVIDHGFKVLNTAFSEVVVTDDPGCESGCAGADVPTGGASEPPPV